MQNSSKLQGKLCLWVRLLEIYPELLHCQMTIAIAEYWDTPSVLDPYCREEIAFQKKNIRSCNCKNCFVFQKISKSLIQTLAISHVAKLFILMTVNMFATRCRHKGKGIRILHGENQQQQSSCLCRVFLFYVLLM